MNVRIVPMDASHLDALAQIEQECFSLVNSATRPRRNTAK